MRENFIINQVAALPNKDVVDISQLKFQLTFLDFMGGKGDQVWVTGSLFNSLIAHQAVKKKYVYDGTIMRRKD